MYPSLTFNNFRSTPLHFIRDGRQYVLHTKAGTAAETGCEVVLMKDAQLAQFMQKHRLPDGNYHLPIDGWEKLSKDKRSRLAARLE